MKIRNLLAFIGVVALGLPFAARAAIVRNIEFPVKGDVTFRDDFGEPRSGGRVHEGNDLMGKKMMPLLSAIDGKVQYLVNPEASWGYAVVLRDSEGYTYHYLHMNNDTPGTDDDLGGLEYAYAPGIVENATVTKGQLVGWMGDSGNAENVGAHLHFEIREPNGLAFSPYQSLIQATRSGRFDPAAEVISSPNINIDKELVQADAWMPVYCVSNSLIKTPGSDAVYYCGRDGRRYVFVNRKTYDTWYKDFSSVQTITTNDMANIPLGKNVTYHPGVKLIKIQTDPKVYAVGHGGTLRWVTTPEIAAKLYGNAWAKLVEDVSDAFFTDYKVGDPITSA